MKTRATFLFFLLVLQSVGAQCADSVTIVTILQKQVSYADKAFGKQPYVLNPVTIPSDGKYFRPDSVYSELPCGPAMHWTSGQVRSPLCIVGTDQPGSAEYSCFIAVPVFNAAKTKCRVFMSTHYSEWGGFGKTYYYEKHGKKWKLVNSTLLWIS